jgi:cytochrome c oxidase subunit 2
MRLAILMMCMLVAAGVFATMFLTIWSSRRDGLRSPSFRQNLAAELVWTAIPCLMIVAAAIPAVIAIYSQAGD